MTALVVLQLDYKKEITMSVFHPFLPIIFSVAFLARFFILPSQATSSLLCKGGQSSGRIGGNFSHALLRFSISFLLTQTHFY